MRQSLLIAPMLLALSCAHPNQKPAEHATSSAATSQAGQQGPAMAGSGQKTCANDLECGDGKLCVRGACVLASQSVAECATVRVHFDFDSSEIAAPERAQLEHMSRCLKADHALHVTIEGNADERGTQDYNLALGDRRATAVSRYLALLGASAGQLKTVSYGKENPLCTEHDEDCWAKNRRAAVKTKETRR